MIGWPFRKWSRALAALALATVVSTPPGRAADAVSSRLLQMINRERLQRGFPALLSEPELDKVASGHSMEMMVNGRIFHESSVTGSTEDRLRDVSFFFSQLGENVAVAPDVESAHGSLMASPHHRDNILNPSFTHIGLGSAATSDSLFVTEIFVREMAPIVPANETGALLARLDAVRRQRQLPPLTREVALAREAQRQCASMVERDSGHPLESVLPLFRGHLKILTFVGEEPDWGVVETEAIRAWDASGAAAVQTRSEKWPHGATWYVILLRGDG